MHATDNQRALVTTAFSKTVAPEQAVPQTEVLVLASGRRSWKKQSVITSALVFVSAVLGVFTQAVLAATLGLSGASDAFFAALTFCTFLNYVLNTALLNREVPELARLLDPDYVPTPAFWRHMWRLTRQLTVLCVAAAIVLFAGADWAMTLIAPGLSGDSRELAVTSLRIMTLPLAFQLCFSGLIAAQFALQRQALVQATAPLYSVLVIAAMVWVAPRTGPIAAAIGAGVSWCLMAVVIMIGTVTLMRRRSAYSGRSAPSKYERSGAIVTLASIVFCAQTLVGPLIASTLAEGAVAQLSFAYRPIDVLARGMPMVIAYMVMPTLAMAYARRSMADVQTQASEALRITLALVLPLAALLAAAREPVVRILYQRSAFSIQAADAVAPTLGWAAAALPAVSTVVVLNAIFFSVGRERWALSMGLAVLGMYVVLGLALGKVFGGAGVALAFCIANFVVAVIATVRAGHIHMATVWRTSWFRWTIMGTLIALIGGSVGVASTQAFPSLVQLGAALALGGLGLLGGLMAVRSRADSFG